VSLQEREDHRPRISARLSSQAFNWSLVSAVNQKRKLTDGRDFPGHPGPFDHSFGSGKSELNGHGTQILGAMGKLNCYATFSKIRGRCTQLSRAVVEQDGDGSFYRDTGVAAAFPLHQGATSPETGFGAFG
jgi:hypothetical protein